MTDSESSSGQRNKLALDKPVFLFESSTVGFGVMRLEAGSSAWSRERIITGRPTIGLARIPYEVRVGSADPFLMDRNTVFFADVGGIIQRRALTVHGMHDDWVEFDPALLAEILSSETGVPHEPGGKFPWPFGTVPAKSVLCVHSLLTGHARGMNWDQLRIEETLINVLAITVRENARARSLTMLSGRETSLQVSRQKDSVNEVRRLLAISPLANHTLDTIAQAVRVSPFQLCRLFKRHTGMRMHLYLERLRLRMALEWVLNTDEPIGTVAVRTGFCSTTHFSNSFLREFNHRPSSLRRDPKFEFLKRLVDKARASYVKGVA